jgi:hypothetical protein
MEFTPMTTISVFYQQCPVCGRSLRIPAQYFGRQMSCTHCEGEFRAGKEELSPAPPSQPIVVPAASVFLPATLGEIG